MCDTHGQSTANQSYDCSSPAKVLTPPAAAAARSQYGVPPKANPVQINRFNNTNTNPDRYPSRIVIEICCDSDSYIGEYAPANVTVYRVTMLHDFRLHCCAQGVCDIISSATSPVCVHVSLPCTGGSPVRFLNIAVGRGEDKRKQQYRDFRRFMKSLAKVAKAVCKHDAYITIEWPKGCDYWHDDRVRTIMRVCCLRTTALDGCAYGLTAMYGSDRGLLMKKTWFLHPTLPLSISACHERAMANIRMHKV